MTVRLALVQLEGLQFGLVTVPNTLLDHPTERNLRQAYLEERVFRDLPVVLVGDEYLIAPPRFHGREDLVNILQEVQMDMVEWTSVNLSGAPLDVN